MTIIDLTHTITPAMPVYPGTEPPTLAPANTYEVNGFRETALSMFSHTGTHMDAPAHLFAEQTTLDAFPAAQFIGRALVIDCTAYGAGDHIPLDCITRYGKAAEDADFLLFYTGWDRYWGTPNYFGDYPILCDEAVDFLIRTNKKGAGLDVIGIDPITDEYLSIHRKLLAGGDFVIIENLTNLDRVGDAPFLLAALPLKFEHADGAPVRAVAILND